MALAAVPPHLSESSLRKVALWCEYEDHSLTEVYLYLCNVVAETENHYEQSIKRCASLPRKKGRRAINAAEEEIERAAEINAAAFVLRDQVGREILRLIALEPAEAHLKRVAADEVRWAGEREAARLRVDENINRLIPEGTELSPFNRMLIKAWVAGAVPGQVDPPADDTAD